jgi:transcription termination factor Rho
VDSRALEVPKRLFGAARVFEEGGSITVIGSCLVETGSRMDDVIFEEFKGTGNMELVLDRKLADRRIYPAINLAESGTRKEERILKPEVLQRVTLLRRHLIDLPPVQAMESLLKQMDKSPTNQAFLDRMVVK